MNKNFDETIKNEIDKRPVILPHSFEEKIKAVINDLPEDNGGKVVYKVRRSTLRTILIASVLALLLMSTAFGAIPKILEMTHNFIKQFSEIDNVNLKSKQEEFEKYNSEVDYTSESEGISVTIDNIASDDNFLIITSTITSPVPIKDAVIERTFNKEDVRNNRSDYFENYLFVLAPYYNFSIDNEKLRISDMSDREYYLKDDHSFVSVQKYMIPDKIPDVFHLTVSADYVCGIKGTWSFNMIIDKSSTAGESVTVKPDIKAEVTSFVYGAECKHNITIDKVSISPFGGQIVISEKGKETFSEFVLRDDKGVYYPVIIDAVRGSADNIVSNSFEFIYSAKKEKPESLTLIPVLTDSRTMVKDIMMLEGNMPAKIEISDIGGYTIENFEADNEKVTITLNPYGALLGNRNLTNGGLGLLYKDGSQISRYISFGPGEYNKETGFTVLTGHWNDNSPDDLYEQIGGIWHINIPNMKLLEDEKITIPLN